MIGTLRSLQSNQPGAPNETLSVFGLVLAKAMNQLCKLRYLSV